MLNQSELSQLITPLLEAKLTEYGFERAEISSSFDHDDDPIVSVRVYYKPGARPLEGTAFLELISSITAVLIKNDDDRSAYFQHVYADGEEADDLLPAIGRRRKRRAVQ